MVRRSTFIRPNVYLYLMGAAILAVLAVWIAWPYFHGHPPERNSSEQSSPAIPLGPQPRFVDITSKAGIDFTHVNGYTTVDKKLLPETMSGGVAFIDFDRSGNQSILFVNSRNWPGTEPSGKPRPTMKLYRNRGDGTFEDATSRTGLDKISFYGMGVTVGDYDNSGYPSIFISGVGDHRLLRNEPDGDGRKFVDVTDSAGDLADRGGWPERDKLPGGDFYNYKEPMRFETSCTWLDYDGDGKLDLFVCCYLVWSPAIDLAIKSTSPGVGRIYPFPKQYDGCQCLLYHNEGGGKFKDVSAQAHIHVFDEHAKPLAKSLGVSACDFEDEGLPSLIVANDSVRNFYLHNKQDGTFEEIGVGAGIVAERDRNARGGMGIDVGEYRPGMLGALVCNFSTEPNTLLSYKKQLRGFQDEADNVGLATPSTPWVKFGCFFFDYDLSGRLGVLTNNGNLDAELSIQQHEEYRQKPQLYCNTGRKDRAMYVPVHGDTVGEDLFVPMLGRGCAYADIDGDGYPDVVLMQCDGEARLLRNEGGMGNHWIRLELEGDGVHANRSAIGAWVEVKTGELVQRRYVEAGRGYLSQSELPLTFGLGKKTKIDSVTIRWPGKDGAKTVIDGKGLAADKFYRVRQEGEKVEEVTPRR